MTLRPVTEPVMARVPVTVKLPALSDAILEDANVLAPVNMFVLARYASDDVPESWLIVIPEIVPVTFKLPMLALAILEEEIVVVLKNEVFVNVF